MGIETIDGLCEEEILDFPTAWKKVIFRHLKNEKRNLVLVEMLRLLKRGKELCLSENEEDQDFAKQLLEFIFSCLKYDDLVKNQVFETLTEFAKLNPKIIFQENPETFSMTLPYLNSSKTIKSFDLIFELFKSETGIRGKEYHFTNEKNKISQLLESLKKYISANFESSNKPLIRPGIAGSFLYFYFPEISDFKISKKKKSNG